MRKSNYDKSPYVEIKGYENSAWRGYEAITSELNRKVREFNKDKVVIAVECYPGVKEEEVLTALKQSIKPDLIIKSEDASYSGEKITQMIQRNLTEDRVFGVLSCHTLDEFFDASRIKDFKLIIEEINKGVVLVYGVGAALIYPADILVYADLARWEIQQRYRRKELTNWKMDNYNEDVLRKYKRGFFVEWRAADRHKKKLYEKLDYLLDTNMYDDPKMITGEAFLKGLNETVKRPFRVVPFFDPGVWGGQWMKEVCDLDRRVENYAWCFDCVPEENSLYLKYGDIQVEVPSINVVLYQPRQLLGEKVHARFGAEFPIRFDFLDTVGGQNLSFQVHPITEYIQEKFGMHYTQDESYYMLDVEEGTEVFLGLKEGIDREAMLEDLEKAQRGEISFPDEKYVNRFPAKKHDHFLIPAGTVHCSGSNSMVLEISATPYIFTFKLWDWDRVGLDGLPRPVHIEHGKEVIQWDRTTKWVEENLVNQIELVCEDDGFIEERTGLHEREFIETRRHWFRSKVNHNTKGGVNVLNLVEGEEAIVESPANAFEPFIVHYAETFIIPAAVGEYTIAPYGKSEGKEVATLKAYVRG
jgi:mannose-6-phosphate isomerase class I